MKLDNIILKLHDIYEKKPQNHRKSIGVLILQVDDHHKHEITLSRSYIRDRQLRNQGYNNFNEEEYFLKLSKILISFPDINSNDIAKDLYVNLNNQVKTVISKENFIETNQNSDENDDVYNCDLLEPTDNSDIFEIQNLMAQMGFPTKFGPKRPLKSKNTKNSQINDMKLISDLISQKVTNLLKNPNKLLNHWLTYLMNYFPSKSDIQETKLAFYEDLLNSDMINEDNKSKIKSCILSNVIQEMNEAELIQHFKIMISKYGREKCKKWIEQINISKDYKESTKFENHDYLKHLLNSIGLAYKHQYLCDKNVSKENPVIYSIISEKSIRFADRNEFSLLKRNPEIYEDLYCGIDEDNPMNKYYFQRYRYFDKFDDGILLDEESWYSVTPGVIAEEIARRFQRVFSENSSNGVVIDAFCGAGGNSIRFAQCGFIVLAVDLDLRKLQLLMHNASIYEVEKRIVPICCDFFKLNEWIKSDDCKEELRNLFYKAIAVNISPPWGGPEYMMDTEAFNIDIIDFDEIMKTALLLSPNISCFIPRQSNCYQIFLWLFGNSLNDTEYNQVEIEQNCLQNKIKAVTLYLGQLCEPINYGLF